MNDVGYDKLMIGSLFFLSDYDDNDDELLMIMIINHSIGNLVMINL